MTPEPKITPRRGRPPSNRAQQLIREAARTLFAGRGYSHVSIRDIASAAGVDSGLIVRHFGSKDTLFLQTMGVDAHLQDIVDGPLDGLGRRMLTRLLEVDPAQIGVYATLHKALDRVEVRDYLAESTERHLVEPLAARLPGPDARLRAQLIAAQIGGLFVAMGIVGLPTAGAVPLHTILDVYAPALQTLIDG